VGVDFYACDYCGETFSDAGDYEYCDCGRRWCDKWCADKDGLREEPNGFVPNGGYYEQETSCKYCREEDFDDHDLLNFLIKIHNSSRSEVIEMYKKWKRDNEGDDTSCV